MNRQRGLLLTILFIVFVAVSAWMVWNQIRTSRETFMSGAPPQNIADVIIPKELTPSQLHPPALLTTDPIRYGGPTSSASIIEYGDYLCDACKTMSPILDRVVASYNGQIRLVWHDFPITTQHPRAVTAAVFVRCAEAQGKFWETHDALMAASDADELTFTAIARSLSLDTTKLSACRADPVMAATVDHDVDVARGDGFAKAPTIFVGTRAFIGTLTEDELRSAIAEFLKS